MKPHPKSRILIERQSKLWWRVVDRETTAHGYSSRGYTVIEENIPRYPLARYSFNEVRGLPKPKFP